MPPIGTRTALALRLALALATRPRFGGEDLLAAPGRGHWYHQRITEDAAAAEGWSAAAAGELGCHTAGVDLYAYDPIWRFRGGRARRHGGRRAAGPLEAVHFDNLASTAEIAEVWARMTGGTEVAVFFRRWWTTSVRPGSPSA